MSIRNKEYNDFSLRLHLKGISEPIVGQFELTYRCNLRCQHCYIVQDARKQEAAYQEVCRILDEVYKEGCLWLCLTGGEPLLREDFLDIYSYAYKKGFIITIFTNACLLTEEIAKYLNRFPPFCIEVTLNAVTKKTYELLTQTPQSFQQLMQGLERIRKYNLPLKLKCQLMTLNFHELDLMRDFYRNMGAEFHYSVLIEPRMDGSTGNCFLRLPIEKIEKLLYGDEIIRGRGEIEENFQEETPAADNLFRCPGGKWAFYVNPYGGLFFCNSLREPSWDLRCNSFREGFYDFFAKIRSAKFKTNSMCRPCPIWHICYSCPGKAKLECGDPEAPIEFYCQLAKLMARTKEKKAV